MAELFFAAREVGFDRAQGPVNQRGDFGVGESLSIAEVKRELLVARERLKRRGEIVAQIGGAHGVCFSGQLFGKLHVLALSTVAVAPVVTGDTEEPGGKSRVAPERGEAAIRVQKRFLREVVGQRSVTVPEVAKEISHGGLVTRNKLSESGAIVARHDPRDELRVG